MLNAAVVIEVFRVYFKWKIVDEPIENEPCLWDYNKKTQIFAIRNKPSKYIVQ